MKLWWGLAAVVGLTACGPSAEERAQEAEELRRLSAEWEAEDAAVQAKEDAAKAGISDIEYPACSKSFDVGVTACGKEVFKRSMSECRSRVVTWEGRGTVLDRYAGDSWLRAAGSESYAEDGERLKQIERMSNEVNNERIRGYAGQHLAVILGDGTSNIRKYYCELDESLKLKTLAQGSIVRP